MGGERHSGWRCRSATRLTIHPAVLQEEVPIEGVGVVADMSSNKLMAERI